MTTQQTLVTMMIMCEMFSYVMVEWRVGAIQNHKTEPDSEQQTVQPFTDRQCFIDFVLPFSEHSLLHKFVFPIAATNHYHPLVHRYKLPDAELF